MAFVVAIIIFAVLAMKGFSDKVELETIRKDTNDWIQDSKSKKDIFISRYVDLALEEKVFQSLDERKKMRNLIIEKIGIDPTCNMIKLAIMARYGKIPSYFASNGISNHISWGGKKTIAGTSTKAHEMVVEQFKFLKWYDEYLRENGMDNDRLYYIHYTAYKTPNRPRKESAIPVSDMSSVQFGGFYFWDGTQPLFEPVKNLY